jgi:hypothetical protein
MDDPSLMCGFQRLGDLLRDRQRLVQRDWRARNPLAEVLAFDQFHHQRARAS